MKPLLLITRGEMEQYGIATVKEAADLALSIDEDDWIKIFKSQFKVPFRTQDATIIAHVKALLGGQYQDWSEYGPAMRDEGFQPSYSSSSKKLSLVSAAMRHAAITLKLAGRNEGSVDLIKD